MGCHQTTSSRRPDRQAPAQTGSLSDQLIVLSRKNQLIVLSGVYLRIVGDVILLDELQLPLSVRREQVFVQLRPLRKGKFFLAVVLRVVDVGPLADCSRVRGVCVGCVLNPGASVRAKREAGGVV
jgi:hypothetical protein